MIGVVDEAARAVVAEVAPFEAALDAALARTGRLMASLAENSMLAHLEPRAAQPAISKISGTLLALVEARAGAVEMRRELVLARTRLGLRETSYGGLGGCPQMSMSVGVGNEPAAELAAGADAF